jgi:hypothetical protein
MHLEFRGDKARAFPSVVQADQIRTLRVWGCKFQTLEPIGRLANLRGLEIAGYPDDSLATVGELRKLEYLRIFHLPKVTDLSPLANLESLITLRLDTLPSWDASGKRTKVESLVPISKLRALKHLELFGVVPVDGSLEPLLACTSLQTARFNQIPRREIDRYYGLSNVANAHDVMSLREYALSAVEHRPADVVP